MDIEDVGLQLDRKAARRRNGLYVTDFSSSEWCQQQVAFSLSAQIPKVRPKLLGTALLMCTCTPRLLTTREEICLWNVNALKQWRSSTNFLLFSETTVSLIYEVISPSQTDCYTSKVLSIIEIGQPLKSFISMGHG